jgi:hypothetical protein
LIKKYKVQRIVKNYVQKVKRVCVLNVPVKDSALESYDDNPLWDTSGFEIPLLMENIFELAMVGIIFTFIFVYPLKLVF